MRAAPGGPRRKARLARALGLDGNPLRRASDRAEAWIRAGLVVIFLIAGPIAALAAGQWTAHAAGAWTNARPHVVHAVLRQPATASASPAAVVRGAQVRVGASSESADGAAVLAAVMTLAGTALALLVVLRLIQRFLNWRRATAWEAAWRVIGPRWTGRRSLPPLSRAQPRGV
jgi:hypothetical protein